MNEELKDDQLTSRVEVKSIEVEKGNKAKKMLVFSEQHLNLEEEGEELHHSLQSSVNERYTILNRRISNDMFEMNNESCIASFDSFLSDEHLASSKKLKKTKTKINEEDLVASTSKPSIIHDQSHDLRKLSVSGAFNQVCDFNLDQYNLENATRFTPFLHPPSRASVESTLRQLGLPEVVNEEPFYSDPADVTKGCEVGNTTVKLTSRSIAHLEEFRGAFFSSKNVLSDERFTHSKTTKKIILTPLKDPPTSLQAKEWLRAKVETKTKKDSAESKPITNKLLMTPLSQGDVCDDESNELSLTISQCSPFSGKGFSDTSNHSTPNAGTSTSRSPLMASTPIIHSVAAARISKKGHSRVSLSFTKTLPTIQEEPSLDHDKHQDLQCAPDKSQVIF